MNWPTLIGKYKLKITGGPEKEWPDEPHSAEYVKGSESITFTVERSNVWFYLYVLKKRRRHVLQEGQEIFLGRHDSLEDIEYAMTFIGGLSE